MPVSAGKPDSLCGSLLADSPFCTSSDKLRIFSFDYTGCMICIDFTWHTVSPETCYVVPAGHNIYLPEALKEHCKCWELHEDILNEQAQHRLCRLRFALHKGIRSGLNRIDQVEQAVDVLSQSLPSSEALHISMHLKYSSIRWYHELASAWCDMMGRLKLSQKISVSHDFAIVLHHHKRTVQRACLETFGFTPGMIYKYYLVSATAKLLAETNEKLDTISEQLEYSTLSKLCRMFKDKTGHSLREFRSLCRERFEFGAD